MFHIWSLAAFKTLEVYDDQGEGRQTSLTLYSWYPCFTTLPPFLCKKWRRLMAFPEWVGGVCVWKGSSRRVKKLYWNVHTRVGSLFSCYLLDYSWLRMTEKSVYELNLLYVLESVIITVVIQGFTTHHTVHTQNFFLVLLRQDLDRKMGVTMFEIYYLARQCFNLS